MPTTDFPEVSLHPLSLGGWAPQRARLPGAHILPFSVISELKARFHFPSGHLASFKGSLVALLALRSQALWPALVSVHNCYARQRKLIHFNGSCVFLFVRSAIAGCGCFLRRLNEISATLHLIGEPRLQAPPRHFPPGRLRVF